MTDEATIREALGYIPPDDRDEWVRVGMAIKDEMGAAGWPVWREWSAQWEHFKERDARTAWRSFKAAHGRVTIRTLYWMAQQRGWKPTGGFTAPTGRTNPDALRRAALERRRVLERYMAACVKAKNMIGRASRAEHPYLAAKGFPELRGLVLDTLLLVPVLDERRAIQSLQTIAEDGTKKNLSGGRMKGGRHMIGQWGGARCWFCEGYATGLSIRAALEAIKLREPVAVCFSDGQLKRIARTWKWGGGVVIADNDQSKAGQRAAEASGHPWWMPPEVGTDFNDYHLEHGLEAAIQAVREVMTR